MSPATALSFNFTNFNESIHDVRYEGDAYPLDSAIQLTDDQNDLTGHVTYLEPLHLWDKPTGSGLGLASGNQTLNSTDNPFAAVDSLDGRKMDAGISYNSSSKNLCVYFTGVTEGIIVPQVLRLQIDLRDHLPEWVVVGFSAATGLYSEFHTIHSWSCNSYFSSPPPPSSSYPPSHIPHCPPKNDKYKVLMIVGLSVACLF
ncbi:agglutinin-2-like [Hevea brasiliensis]|uniref:agglutinin-2-like n=1 Tax=Hevea brasiliensis TaxID=3981 RepID=UPI0025D98F2C|nr:agglutinin-2-like [Hevea brasiliensis]